MPLYTRTNDFNLIGQADGATVSTGNSDDNGQDAFWVVSGQPKWDTTTTKVGDTAVRLEAFSGISSTCLVEHAKLEVGTLDYFNASNTWLYWHSGGPATGSLSIDFRNDISQVYAEVKIDQATRVLTLTPTLSGPHSGTYAIPDDTWVRVQTFISGDPGGRHFKARVISETGQVLDEVIHPNPIIDWNTRKPRAIRWTLNTAEATPLKVTIDDLMMGWDGQAGDLFDYWDSGPLTIPETATLDATAGTDSTLEVWQHVILPKTWKNGVDRLSAFNLNAEVRDRFKAWQGQEWRDWTPEWRFLKMAAEDIPLNVQTGNIGTGTLTGKFLELGQLRMFRIRWDIGTGMTYDTSDDPGFWTFTLPTGGAMIPGSLSGEGQLDPGPTWIQPGAIERFQLSEAHLYTQGIKTNGVIPIAWISAQPYPLQWNTGTVGSKARTNGAVLELGGTYLVEPDPEETS